MYESEFDIIEIPFIAFYRFCIGSILTTIPSNSKRLDEHKEIYIGKLIGQQLLEQCENKIPKRKTNMTLSVSTQILIFDNRKYTSQKILEQSIWLGVFFLLFSFHFHYSNDLIGHNVNSHTHKCHGRYLQIFDIVQSYLYLSIKYQCSWN